MSPVSKDNPQRVGNIIALAALILAFATWAMGAVHVMTNEHDSNNQRVTAVETKQTDQEKRLDRIENKVDNLDDKADRILDELRTRHP